MQSTAARREEIQKRLQILKEEREREQQAFDELAVAHPELSVDELKERAKASALELAPKSLEVAGATLNVGDYVGTIDDVAVMTAAERGILARDPVKRVYLGERGKVLRVIESFHGKPAVELRFADGAEKVFFAECLDLGTQSGSRRPAANAGVSASSPAAEPGRTGGPSASAQKRANPTVMEEKPEPLPVPSWTQLASERRASRNAASTSSMPSSPLIPLPPSTPPREQSAPQPAAAKPSHAPQRSAQPSRPAAVPPLPLPPPPAPAHQSFGLVKEALSGPPSQLVSPTPDGLGKPSDGYYAGAPVAGKASLEAEDLLKTPRPDFLEVSPPPQRVTPCPVELSRVPTRCPTRYVAKFSLDDKGTHIPRYSATGGADVRRCWVAGHTGRGGQQPLRFHALALRPSADTLEAVLTLVTRELSWDRAPEERARRLFTVDGHELMWPDAIVDGLRIVATPGNGYDGPVSVTGANTAGGGGASVPRPGTAAGPRASVPPSAVSRGVRSSPPPQPPKASPPTAAVAASQTASVGSTAIVVKRHAAPVVTRVSKSPRPGTKTPPVATRVNGNAAVQGRVAAPRPAAAAAKAAPAPATRSSVIHIHVYENGIYDGDAYNRVYRTVTIRPTYKTLNSVKTLITRELEWRDGRKVDVLFDPTGVEVTELAQLTDGGSIVASAGDRFVVPFPKTALHREAMKMSGA